MRDIRDVNADAPLIAIIADLLNAQRIVEVTRARRVDGEHAQMTKVPAIHKVLFVDAQVFDLLLDLGRERFVP